MGGGISKFPTIVIRDPLPTTGSFIGGLSKGGNTQDCGDCSNPRDKRTCKPCRLVIAQGVSSSGAKLYREYGNISLQECTKFSQDSQKVNANEMAFDEFKANLMSGKYYARQENGFCSQMMFDSGDIANAKTINEIPWSKVRRPKIRKLTSDGGFSSITKLYIKPTIPFQFKFNRETVSVNVMTLFHPSPIRVENVQHDAMLTLGDPGDSSTKTVLMIPLVASNTPGTSGTFFSRIVSYMPGVLQPNPATGLYDPVDAPTGKDWNLSMLFPGTPNGGETVVKSSYYAWYSVPPMDEVVKENIVRPDPWANTIRYGWKARSGESTRFIMLAEPIPINTFDMQTIRMLPATPSEEALPFVYPDSVVYNAALECKKQPTPSTSIATPPSQRESFDNPKCDPFAQLQPQVPSLNPSTLMTIIGSVIGAIAIFVGVYLALKYATDNDWGPKLMKWGRAAGKAIASGPGPGAPPVGPRDTERRPGEEFAKENTAAIEARKKAAEKKKQEAEIARAKAEAEAEEEKKAEAEEDAASAERRARRAAMTPLDKAQAKRRDANRAILQLQGDINVAEGELGTLQTYLKNATPDLAASQARSVAEQEKEIEKLKSDLAQAKREVEEADTEIKRLTQEQKPVVKRKLKVELTDAQDAQIERLESGIQKLNSNLQTAISDDQKTAIRQEIDALEKGIASMKRSPETFAETARTMQKEIAGIRATAKSTQDAKLEALRKELETLKQANARAKDTQTKAQSKIAEIAAKRKAAAAGTGLMSESQMRERDAKMEQELKTIEDQISRDAAVTNRVMKQAKEYKDTYADQTSNQLVQTAETTQSKIEKSQEENERLARSLREAQALQRRSQAILSDTQRRSAISRKGGKKTRRQ